MAGTDLTILVALAAGVISFLSPCVLPLVPAYLGQLTAIAVAGSAAGRDARRAGSRCATRSPTWPASGPCSRVLGITATFAAGPLVDYLPALRTIGGVVLIVLGLNLAGLLHIPGLERTWRPLDAGAAGSLATATGTTVLRQSAARRRRASAIGSAAGSSSSRGGWLASFGLGAIFAIGWTPCIGIILGGILTLAATSGDGRPGRASCSSPTRSGSGCRSSSSPPSTTGRRGVMAPLVRHGRTVSLIGGLLVVAIGVAMVFDWLALLPRYFNFNTAI